MWYMKFNQFQRRWHHCNVFYQCASVFIKRRFAFNTRRFLLGRYATDRAILLKNHIKQQTEQRRTNDAMSNITSILNRISKMDILGPLQSSDDFRSKLKCTKYKDVDVEEGNFDNINLATRRALSLHMEALRRCFWDVGDFLEGRSATNFTSD
ncbi:PREDICTED: uncharacterized protein LOC108564981 isoform X2 [Nicrophorus vespilloides]|uniref:Uncharacterized protein LOC108564981 isoform X2 n=1 Tax=Nicrophorus vespilloides TaxID=110193 RepID=A0ABM1MYP5_NICVS|nr:PREDICTED: uncharacterized protein LOC108564981 isoform X2 [Nicrophorus vespilloides]